MKYIRTQDRIYKDKPLAIKYTKNDKGSYCMKMKEKDIIKIAGTIEELCDEFVFVSDNYKPIISSLPFIDLRFYAKHRIKEATCYGAIWTSKGLQFVAHRNSKGEFELL